MLTMTWGNLRDREFMNSFGMLFAKPMGYDFGMRLALIGREVKKQQKLCDEVHLNILKKYGDEDKEKPGVYSIREVTRKEYIEDMTKLDKTEFTVRVTKLDALKLSETVQFSPQDLLLLEPLLLPFEIPVEQTEHKIRLANPEAQPAVQ